METRDRIRGCLIGGAAGDALGYAVEFMSEKEIRSAFGEKGITGYKRDEKTYKALISDDTQMSLFTANGILFWETRGMLRGIAGSADKYLTFSYKDWLWTQEHPFGKWPEVSNSWILDLPELYSRRAPGNTCLSALKQLDPRNNDRSFCMNPINSSKGCGGVMRVAPIGLEGRYIRDHAEVAAEAAAITHGHSLGYMPAAVLAQMIHSMVFAGMDLEKALENGIESTKRLFRYDLHLDELTEILKKAVELSGNGRSDIENIRTLGEGWVAEETLAIAVYCSLRHKDSFSDGIIAAVNHDGDSDSTGAVTGNILGALLGFEAIEGRWKENLELEDVILELADDLNRGCELIDGYRCGEEWERKYVHCTGRKAGKYKVITLCGSTRFKDEFIETQKRLTLDGNIVISVGLFGHSGDDEVWSEGVKEMLDDMHKRKIDMADEIFVINRGGYIGSSTRSEIDYALSRGKTVRYLE